MARPPLIQKLRHGRLLSGRVFRFFVETWNWLSAYVDNMRGDFETNPKEGLIYVDRTNPDWPVIRFRRDRFLGGAFVGDGPFTPVFAEDGETLTGFTNCFWQNGGKTVLMADQESIPGTDGFIVLRVDATPAGNGEAELRCFATIEDVQAAQADPKYYIIPLYIVAASKITLDMRRIPHVFMAEVY